MVLNGLNMIEKTQKLKRRSNLVMRGNEKIFAKIVVDRDVEEIAYLDQHIDQQRRMLFTETRMKAKQDEHDVLNSAIG